MQIRVDDAARLIGAVRKQRKPDGSVGLVPNFAAIARYFRLKSKMTPALWGEFLPETYARRLVDVHPGAKAIVLGDAFAKTHHQQTQGEQP